MISEIDLSQSTNEQVLEALKDLVDSGQMEYTDYSKGIVTVAAEYAKDGQILTALSTLALVPPGYFELVQLQQMKDDPVYAQVASGLAGRIVRYGLDAKKGDEFAPNQKPGEA